MEIYYGRRNYDGFILYFKKYVRKWKWFYFIWIIYFMEWYILGCELIGKEIMDFLWLDILFFLLFWFKREDMEWIYIKDWKWLGFFWAWDIGLIMEIYGFFYLMDLAYWFMEFVEGFFELIGMGIKWKLKILKLDLF